MSKLKNALSELDALIKDKQPRTMDDLLNLVGESGLIRDYGYSAQIIRYMGAVQGVRLEISGRTKHHYLPSKDTVYSVFQGLENYIKAGW